jgi:GNAT superfamily N-acetyltransferase
MVEARELRVDDHPERRDVGHLREQLDTFNVAATGVEDGRELAIFLRDDRGQIMAGLYGHTWGRCLDIRALWVRADSRGRGYGRALIVAAESEARARGCRLATLETHSFQAPDFYRKLGWEVFGVLDDYPAGHRKYYLKKSLD